VKRQQGVNPRRLTLACARLTGRRQWVIRIEAKIRGRRNEEAGLPLKLSLKPGEKFVLNGAVVQNGDRRGVLVLQNKASVLREKDIMQENEVTTPARRIYFPVMMMYLDEAGAERYYDEFATRLNEFMSVIANPGILAECVSISKHCMQREYYKALMLCRKLIEYEDERLGNVPSGVPTGG
jgi:flagellar protein FlbT